MSSEIRQHARPVLVILAVRDVPRAARFYRSCFDWQQTVAETVYAEFLTEGGWRIGLYAREAFGRTAGGLAREVTEGELSGAELYCYTDDMARSCERLLQGGAMQTSPAARRHWGEEAAYFLDLDGHLLVMARRSE